MEGLGILPIFLLVAAVLALLIPFFIFKIRNQVISINEKMDKIIDLLSGKSIEAEVIQDNIKFCTHCGFKNRTEDSTCMNCSKPI